MIGKSLLLNHSPSEWFSLYNKKGQAVCLSFLLLGEMCPCMACRPLLAAAFLLCRHPVFPYGTGAVSFPGKFPVPPSGNRAVRFSASTHLRAGVYTLHCRRWAFLLYGVPGFPAWGWRCQLSANSRCPRPGTGLLASLLPHTREPGHIPSAPTAGSWLFCCVGTRFSRMELALPAPRQISGAPVSRGRTVPHI